MEKLPDFRTIVDPSGKSAQYRFVMNRQDADDLAQEVFIQVYEALHRFRKEPELSTWIFAVLP